MGVAYQLSCGHCAYSQNIYIGFGFNYCSLSSILEWYKDDVGRQRIREFIQTDKEASFECFDGLYVCQSCRYLLNEVYLHINSDSDAYTNRYTCPRCSALMPPKPIDYIVDIQLDCPDCGNEKLKVQSYMDWD
ncbi:hypothetical protein MH117_03740 [Paenibacillus sp. ACRRX]|uniref:hypothetical protein n=1 Tax=Paenibacillus sp. ACRRX TaxID=2918206 RepID=UPI001EF52B48|nr:hypothetical protein [Paenibacillus sp. ACRRX]MCG7406517.1 hypothetical protein [Paenibacillus sp. ACRRX]